MEKEKTIALLIDSENISDKYMEIILNEVNKHGKIVIKRIYGDFTTGEHAGWKRILLKYGLSPMQQYSYTTGKNSTDSAIIIDAMDILRDGRVDCFCLATSDSDFTKLAIRLKESGIFVIAAGESKTPKVFADICDRFILVDQLYSAKTNKFTKPAQKPAEKSVEKAPEKQVEKASEKSDKKDKKAEKISSFKQEEKYVLIEKEDKEQEMVSIPPIEEICSTASSIISDISDDSGNAIFATVISELYKTHPEFDSRHYLFKKAIDLFKQRKEFSINTNANGAVVIKNLE